MWMSVSVRLLPAWLPGPPSAAVSPADPSSGSPAPVVQRTRTRESPELRDFYLRYCHVLVYWCCPKKKLSKLKGQRKDNASLEFSHKSVHGH